MNTDLRQITPFGVRRLHLLPEVPSGSWEPRQARCGVAPSACRRPYGRPPSRRGCGRVRPGCDAAFGALRHCERPRDLEGRFARSRASDCCDSASTTSRHHRSNPRRRSHVSRAPGSVSPRNDLCDFSPRRFGDKTRRSRTGSRPAFPAHAAARTGRAQLSRRPLLRRRDPTTRITTTFGSCRSPRTGGHFGQPARSTVKFRRAG